MPQVMSSISPSFCGKLCLGDLRCWGVDRVSVDWGTPRVRDLVRELEAWGREVDIQGVADVDTLLQSALLLPRSVTADLSGLGVQPLQR